MRNMALSVSGFPAPIQPTEPNADPSLEPRRLGRGTDSPDGLRNAHLRTRFFGSQPGLSKLADSIIHTEFSHNSLGPLYPSPDAHHFESYSFDPTSILPDLFPNPLLTQRISVVSRFPTANFIPAYVYAMSGNADYDNRDSQQPVTSPVLPDRPIKPAVPPVQVQVSPPLALNTSAQKPTVLPARITVGTPTRRNTASSSVLNSPPAHPVKMAAAESTVSSMNSVPPTPCLPSPTTNAHISTSPSQSDSSAPNIPPPVPTPGVPAPSKSPVGLVSPSISSSRPNITINTSGPWNPPAPTSLQQPLPSQPLSQPPSSHQSPHSRVLISATKQNPSPHNKAGINLRYRSMAIVDPSSSNQASSSHTGKGDRGISSSTRKPQTRTHRPKTSPGPRVNMFEAIPSSWASASRPSDLRPVYPNQNTAQLPASKAPPRKGASLPKPPPPSVPAAPPRGARPNVVQFSRSRSADKHATASRVVGPRMPRQPTHQFPQPTPKRLSLGMVMNTSKLVSTSPPPTSIPGYSIPSVSASLPKPATKPSIATSSTAATKVLPIRSIPSSPTGSPSLTSHVPAIARLPISGSPDYKREISPPPTSPPYRSAPFVPTSSFRAWPCPQPASPATPSSPPPPRALPAVSHPPSFRSAPIVSLSPFSSNLPSSLSSPSLSPKSPPTISITTPTTATTAGSIISPVTSPGSADVDKRDVSGAGMGTNEEDVAKRSKRASSPDSPTSVLSYASVTIFTPGGTKRTSVGSNDGGVRFVEVEEKVKDTLMLQQYPYTHDSNDLELNQQHLSHLRDNGPSTPEPDSEFNPTSLYEWGVEEIGHYNDQLFCFPTSPTSSASDLETYGNKGLVEVFVDNVYYNDAERSPSPIVYARPRTDSDDESDAEYGVRRRRHRLLADDESNSISKHTSRSRSRPGTGVNPTRPALGPDSSVPTAFLAGGMPNTLGSSTSTSAAGSRRPKHGHSGHTVAKPSSPISYHSDDSSLGYYGARPRRKRREQLRSYRHSFRRSPITPTSGPGTTAGPLSPRHLVPSSSNIERTTQIARSPSPILYARRRSLDFLTDSDSEDTLDDRGGATSDESRNIVGSWWGGAVTPYGFRLSEPVGGGGGPRRKIRRRTVQPRSFLHEYSTPPDVQRPFGDSLGERERSGRERMERVEKERGRKRERVLIPMPLVNYTKDKDEKEKKEREREREREKEKEREREREKDKPRMRKTSRGIFDELAAVAARNTISGRKQTGDSATNSRSRSPKGSSNKNREKDGKEAKEKEKRKWAVWDLNLKDKLERAGDSSTSGSVSIEAGVLNIAGGSGHGVGTYDDWSAEWDESPTTTKKKRRQRHSLAGLEFQ